MALIKRTLNPFRTYNFGDKELMNVRGEHLNHVKLLEIVDPRFTREEALDEREGSEFQEETREVID